jgi:hypothetical protein
MQSDSSTSIVNVKMSAPLFMTFKLKDSEKTIINISLSNTQKALDAVAGKVKTS